MLPLDPRQVVEGVEPSEVDWPLEHVSLEPGSCVVVTGPDAEVLGLVLHRASEITRWRTGSSEVFSLLVRPVLPHESGCPEDR